MKLICEVDVDGVLTNQYYSLEKELKKECPEFDHKRHIHSWGMHELDNVKSGLRKLAFDLFGKPEFIGKLDLYEGIHDSLLKLQRILEENNCLFIINSSIFNEKCRNARIEYLDNIFGKGNVPYILEKGPKNMIGTLLTIEDNVDNMKKSRAAIKLLIRQNHNKNATLSDLGTYTEAIICNDFNSAIRHLEFLNEKYGGISKLYKESEEV